MMLERHYEATRINEIINDPSILPWIKGKHESLDLTAITANPNHVCLVGEHGCVVFYKHQIGVYEFHTSVLPAGRGAWMQEMSKQVFAWMFTKTDAYELMTKCPDGNLAAKAGARAVGCSALYKTKPLWPTAEGLVAVDVYSILLQHWAKQADFTEHGKWFHETLAKKVPEEPHADDPLHDQYVGIAIEMIRGGQACKAVGFYNRWAVMAGYLPVTLLSLEPLMVDIGTAKLIIKDNNFEVV